MIFYNSHKGKSIDFKNIKSIVNYWRICYNKHIE